MRVLSVTLLVLLACALSSARNSKCQRIRTILFLDKTVLKYVFKNENKIFVCGAGRASAEVLCNILIHVSLLKIFKNSTIPSVLLAVAFFFFYLQFK